MNVRHAIFAVIAKPSTQIYIFTYLHHIAYCLLLSTFVGHSCLESFRSQNRGALVFYLPLLKYYLYTYDLLYRFSPLSYLLDNI